VFKPNRHPPGGGIRINRAANYWRAWPKPLLRPTSVAGRRLRRRWVRTTLIMSFFWLQFCCWGSDKCGSASCRGKISFENALSTATHIQNFRFSRISFILPDLVQYYNFGSPLDSVLEILLVFCQKGKSPSTSEWTDYRLPPTWVCLCTRACVGPPKSKRFLRPAPNPRTPAPLSIRPCPMGVCCVLMRIMQILPLLQP